MPDLHAEDGQEGVDNKKLPLVIKQEAVLLFFCSLANATVTQVVELFCTHSPRRHITPILPLIVFVILFYRKILSQSLNLSFFLISS